MGAKLLTQDSSCLPHRNYQGMKQINTIKTTTDPVDHPVIEDIIFMCTQVSYFFTIFHSSTLITHTTSACLAFSRALPQLTYDSCLVFSWKHLQTQLLPSNFEMEAREELLFANSICKMKLMRI